MSLLRCSFWSLLSLTLWCAACDRAGAKPPVRMTPSTHAPAASSWSAPGKLAVTFVTPKNAEPLVLGDTIATVSGPGLKTPLNIPMMMRFDDTDDRCRFEPPQVDVLWIPQRRVLVIEQNVLCGEPVCKIWDVEAKVWGIDEGCPEGPTAQFMLTHMSDDMFFLYGYTEGPGMGQVIRWSQGSPQQDLLSHVSSPEAPIKTPKGWILESLCDPASGQVAPSIDPARSECPPQDGCGYCVLTNTEESARWLWQPGLPPQPLEATPSVAAP